VIVPNIQRPAVVVREPHAVAILACDNPEAIVLDFMKPLAAGGQLVGLCGEARRNEPGREGTLQHVE
jgi:hypothetical protein